MDKLFISAEEQLLDSYRLGVKIHASGFRPDFIVGLWRGGSPVGIGVQDCLEYLGVKTDHISIRTSYTGMDTYTDMIENESGIRVHGLQYLLENLEADKRLLIVDDVYSTGLSVKAVIDQLSIKTRRNMPVDVRIAVIWYKPTKNRTGQTPDYHLHETDKWLVLPYELSGLSLDEIYRNKTGVKEIFEELEDFLRTDRKNQWPLKGKVTR